MSQNERITRENEIEMAIVLKRGENGESNWAKY